MPLKGIGTNPYDYGETYFLQIVILLAPLFVERPTVK